MSTLQAIIRKKYLACIENLKPKDRLTDAEYDVVSACKLDDLYNVESAPSILELICEGEKKQTAEYYDQQERKYHRSVATLYRKVKPKVRPTLPRIAEVEVPAPAGDQVMGALAIVATLEPTDAIRESPAGEPRSFHTTDLYQIVEEIPPLEQPIVGPIEDDNFGSKDVDGTRDFLELCTGTNLPPMALTEISAQDLVLIQLGIPARPLNDHFQEIDLRGIGTPLFKNPLTSSTPFVETVPRSEAQDPLGGNLEANVIPTTSVAVALEDGQMQAQEPIQARSVVEPTVNVPANAVSVVIPVEANPNVAAFGEVANSELVVQAERIEGVVQPENGSASAQAVEEDPPVPLSRRVPDFTRQLAFLKDRLPCPRKSFDIFSYHQRGNLFPMIEAVQSYLFRQQPKTQPQTLVESSLVMRAAGAQNVTHGASILYQSNEQGSRELFPTPAVETSGSRTGMPPTELSQLADQGRGLIQTSGNATNVPSLTPLESIDGNIVELSNRYRLPSLEVDATMPNGSNAAGARFIGPKRHTEDAQAGVALETVTPRDEQLPRPNLNTLFNPTTTAVIDAVESTTAQIDSMLLDILILVQSEMCEHGTNNGHIVSIQRLKELLKVTERIDVAKIMKNIILLKQARLLVVACAEDRSIEGVTLKFPAD